MQAAIPGHTDTLSTGDEPRSGPGEVAGMDDEEGKGAAASESTGVDVNLDVADVQAKASTSMHDTCRTTAASAASAAVAAESSTSTSTSTTSSADTAAAAEADQDGDDAGTKMNHNNQPNSFHHDPGYSSYGGGGTSRRPLPMSLPARSSNSFTPINNYPHQDDHHNATLTLPPIGSINSLPPPQTQAPRQRTSLPTARPAASAPSNVSYYPGHTDGRLLPSNFGISPGEMAQYALLPPEPKAFQRQAPKKEIKRRTKTGCMTCRKRRIKCDEAHPSCNNCKKSKRDCLGYDPVFREQSIPGHSNSRSSPAPSSPSSRGPTTPNSYIEPSAPETTPARPLPTAATLVAAASRTQEPHDNYWKTVIDNLHYPVVLATDKYKDTIETTLSSATPATATNTTTSSDKQPFEPSRSGTFFDPVTAAASESRQDAKTEKHTNDYHLIHKKGPRSRLPGVMRVADLINGFGASAPPPEPVPSDDVHQEVVKVYHEMYANGLSALFESNWFFFQDDGKMSFPRTGNTAGHMAAFLKLIRNADIQDHTFMAHCSVVELRLVWELAKLAGTAGPDKADNRMRVSLPPDNDAIEVKNRFSVVDALLGGDFLPWNPLAPAAEDPNPHREREFDFWYQLGEYLRWNADQDTTEEDKRRQDTIDRMRWLLDGRENRDVLYSIVVLRHYTTRFDMAEAMKAKYHLPEDESKNRVVVASKFISQQAQVTGGTTNVIRRICDIAARLFVNPSDNIRRGVRP